MPRVRPPKPPKKKVASTNINVYLPLAIIAAVDECARRAGDSRSAQIAHLLGKALDLDGPVEPRARK